MPSSPHILVGAPVSQSIRQCDPAPLLSENSKSHSILIDRLAFTLNHAMPISIIAGIKYIPLNDEFTLVCSPERGTPIIALDTAAQQVLAFFEEPRSLAQLAQLTSIPDAKQIAERLVVHGLLLSSEEPIALSPERDTLSVWLHVTNACNLACSYCYVAKTNEAMDEMTGLQAIDAAITAARRHGYQQIALKYAGGEAALNFKLVCLLHDYAIQRVHAAGLLLSEALLSNGTTLTTARLEFLHKAKIGLMISLDGPPIVNDLLRPGIHGKSPTVSVMASIDRALAIGFSPDINIVVSPQSVPYLAETLRFVLDRGLRFSLNFVRDHAGGFDNPTLRQEVITQGMLAAFEELARTLPRERVIDGLVDFTIFDGLRQQVCGAGDSLLVVDQQGRVARCQTELQRPVSHITSPDPLMDIRLEPGGFQRLSPANKHECASCIWRHWCAGGCPAYTYQLTGRNDLQSPYCSVYKQLYPKVLELEGMRLLKWASTGIQHGVEVWV